MIILSAFVVLLNMHFGWRPYALLVAFVRIIGGADLSEQLLY